MLRKKILTKEQAFQKMKHYCSYQERCHAEAREKAYSFGLRKPDVEELIAKLIQENYLNEERFAILFTGGKFRMKKWGRSKIKYELKQKKVSDYCIKKALKQLDENEYLQTLEKLAMEKWKTLRSEKNIFIKKRKTQDYLVGKGYEFDLCVDMLNKINGKG